MGLKKNCCSVGLCEKHIIWCSGFWEGLSPPVGTTGLASSSNTQVHRYTAKYIHLSTSLECIFWSIYTLLDYVVLSCTCVYPLCFVHT